MIQNTLEELRKLAIGYEPARFDSMKRPRFSAVVVKTLSWSDNLERMDAWSSKRLRYHRGSDVFDVGSPDMNICYTLYRDALAASKYQYLIDKFTLDAVMKSGRAKELSEYAKKRGARCDDGWRMLVDIHRLQDFVKPSPVAEFALEIADWVQRKPVHTWNGDEDKWYMIYEETFHKVLRESGVSPARVRTVDEFLINGDLWCTSGSGFEPDYKREKYFNVDKNIDVNVKKTKWSVRWKKDKYMLKKLMFKRRKQVCKAVAKSEPAKSRAVISSDLSLYLKMSYVSHILEQMMSRRRDSTLFMSKRATQQMWQGMAVDGTVRMPIDQSEFDKNVSMRQVTIMIRVIRAWLWDMIHDPVVDEIMDLIGYAVDGGVVIVGDSKVEIQNGILSGWRWTALLDTLVNLTEVAMAARWVSENSNIDMGLVDYNAQGDDDKLKFKNRRGAIAFWLAFESFGLFVNPGKFFLDVRRDEYLRRVLDSNVLTGYPARSVNSIMFRNPLSERETVGPERIRTAFAKWKLFCERIGNTLLRGSFFWREMISDCVNSSPGLTRELVENMVVVNPRLGGIGYVEHTYTSNVIIPVAGRDRVDRVCTDEVGYVEWFKFVSGFGVEERVASQFYQSTLDLRSTRSLPSWVKYIFTDTGFSYSVPSGMQPIPGSVGVGPGVRQRCRQMGLRWFPRYEDLVSAVVYGSWGVELVTGGIREHVVVKQCAKDFQLEPVPGISVTVARMSSDPMLAWANYAGIESRLEHKPRRWVKDYLSGRLKASVAPRAGWGTDVLGYYANLLLKGCINYFLSITRPTNALWDNLLDEINVVIPTILATLPLRVVE
jgi:hypothetical protein